MDQLRKDQEANLLVEELARGGGNDLVRFIARRLGSVADARDIAHEAFARLLRVKCRDLIRDPQAYLYRVAVNIVREFELQRKADTLGLASCTACQIAASPYGQPEDDLQALQTRRRIETVLAGLTPRCRSVVILCRRDGLSYKEISARTGISINMVKKYLTQGLRHCRQHLAELR